MTAKLGALAAGHPLPAPSRFCSVTSMAVARDRFVAALRSPALLLNRTGVPCTEPAAALRASAARNVARDGGHEHGISVLLLVAATKPSHEPACVLLALVLGTTPNSGTSEGSMAPGAVPPEAEADGAEARDVEALDAVVAAAALDTTTASAVVSGWVGRATEVADRARTRMVVKDFILTGLFKDSALPVTVIIVKELNRNSPAVDNYKGWIRVQPSQTMKRKRREPAPGRYRVNIEVRSSRVLDPLGSGLGDLKCPSYRQAHQIQAHVKYDLRAAELSHYQPKYNVGLSVFGRTGL